MADTITDRIDAITSIPDAWRRADPPPPRSVRIELTARCNFACSFCARSAKLRDQRDMDRALFERLLRAMRAAGVEEIGLFYLGESFLCRWQEEAIAFATPERLEGCFGASLDSLKFSFNYADAEQNSQIAQVKPALFWTMVRNVAAARDVRDPAAAETGHRCGLYASSSMTAGRVYALSFYTQADLVADDEKARGWQPTPGNRGRVGALRDPIPCWLLFTEGDITWDGKRSARCFDQDVRFHMAGLNETSFRDGWRSDRRREWRSAHLAHRLAGTSCDACVAVT